MRVEAYHECKACGRELETATMYRRHAYCPNCS